MNNKLKSFSTTLVILYAITINNLSIAQSYQWATNVGGELFDYGYNLTTDAAGNVIVTGRFISQNINFGNTILTNAGSSDFFIVKYNSSGDVLWAKSALGTDEDWGYGITTDAAGNIFVTGGFASPSLTFGNISLINQGEESEDVFIAKYDSNGNLIWVTSAGGTDFDRGQSITTDNQGNIVLTGTFSGPTINFGNITLTSAGARDFFVVKYDSNGNEIWATSNGGEGNDEASSISIDAAGNIAVAGKFESPSMTLGTNTLTNTGNSDIFVVKYFSDGNVLWAKGAGSSGTDKANSIATDALGNIVVAGTFEGSTMNFENIALANAGSFDIFIAKYNSNGNLLWAKAEGGTYLDEASAITTDPEGNVIVTGSFWSPSITFDTTTFTNAGNEDIFIVKYNSNGNQIWATSAGGSYPDYGYGITSDANGNIIVTGAFSSASITLGTNILTNAIEGYEDVFIAKILRGSTVGIKESLKESELTFYPNPAKDQIIVKADVTLLKSDYSLFDCSGKVVVKGKINAENTTINLDNLSAGVYLLSVGEQLKQTLRVIKE